MKILMIGEVGSDGYHVGDEAAFQVALCELASLPATQVTVVAAQPALVAARHAVQAIAPLGFPRTPGAAGDDERELRLQHVLDGSAIDAAAVAVRAAVAAADGVVVAGGGNLSAASPHLLYERVAVLRLAAAAGVPAVVAGLALGPRLTPRQRDRMVDALGGAQLVGVCDAGSMALVQGSPAAGRAVPHIDDAVRLAPTRGERVAELPEQYVCLAAHQFLSHADAVLAELAALVAEMHRTSGLPVVLVASTWPVPSAEHAAGAGTASEVATGVAPRAAVGTDGTDDLTLATHLAALIDDSCVAVVAPAVDACTTARVIGSASALVSTRCHPIVLALAAGVPCMAISTDHHNAAVLSGALAPAGLGGWRLPATALAGPAAASMFGQLWQQRRALGEHIAAATAAWPELHTQRWQAVRAALSGGTEPDSLRLLTAGHDEAAAAAGVLAPADPLFAALVVAEAEGHSRLLEMQQQFDTAEEYALSVRTALAARDTEIRGLHEQALELQRQLAAEQSTIARLDDELQHATQAADRARELVHTIDQHRTAELAAIHNTRVMRWSRTPRAAYRRLRRAFRR